MISALAKDIWNWDRFQRQKLIKFYKTEGWQYERRWSCWRDTGFPVGGQVVSVWNSNMAASCRVQVDGGAIWNPAYEYWVHARNSQLLGLIVTVEWALYLSPFEDDLTVSSASITVHLMHSVLYIVE